MTEQGSQAHLYAPGLHVAPVRDVAEVDHGRHIHDWVAQAGASEPAGVLPHQVPCQQASMAASHHSYLLLIYPAWAQGPAQHVTADPMIAADVSAV